MAGQQGAQGVYEGAITDFERQQKIDEFKRKQEQRKAFEAAVPNLMRTTPAQFESITTPSGYAPQQTEVMPGQVSPNFGMTRLPDVTTQREIAPARTEFDNDALLNLAMQFPEQAAPLISSIKGVRDLNPPKEIEYKDVGDKLVPVYKTSGQPVQGLKPLPKNLTPEQLRQAQFEQFKFANPSASDLLSASTTRRGQDLTNTRALESMGIQNQLKNLQAQKLQMEIGQTISSKEGAIDSYNTSLQSIDRLLKNPGLSSAVGATLQPRIPFYGEIPGTNKVNFLAELETFKSQTFLPMVQNLRGMGALSDAEGKKLTDAVGALNPDMSEKAFKESLIRIKADLTRAKNRIGKSIGQPAQGVSSNLKGGLSADDEEAINWASKNPNDPRAKAIKQRLGL
jgi:hypothetical protein